jgi:protein O-GlcNAc transferase
MLLRNLRNIIGLRRRPSAEDLISKGTVLLNAGAWQDASACFEAARRTAPHDFTLLNNLGLCHANSGNLEAAAECFRESLRLAPDSAPALMNLGNIEMIQANPEAAIAHYEAALAGTSAEPGLVNNLGMAYRATAQVDAAIRCFRRALSIEPRFRDAHDNLLYCMQLLPEYGPEKLHSEHRRWAETHEAPLQADARLHANDRDPRRRLRIGYVSPDFHRHAVAKFFEPVIAHHDHERFQIHCYHNTDANDAVTGRIRRGADVWRDVAQLSDESLAARIRADGIDILVDLAGHTRGGRLLCFARKPAPLQLTYLGHGNTTGLRAMDFRITDAVADPPGEAERFHSEQLLRLPHAQWCFRPDGDALPAGPLPALAAGHITFGSFNNLWKINPAVIGAWARVLLRVSGSKLLIIGIPGKSTRERFEAAFAGHGVHPSRLSLLPPVSDADFWRLRHEIDIALDPFPYNGVTSTCEALYAGTPMATLAGTYGQSRTAASILTAVRLEDMVARTEEEYVEINVRLASDMQRLSQLRASLRQRMQDSPLMDYHAFTFALEGLYRGIWTNWVTRQVPPP